MEKVGFLGACDKTNLIMYVAKALASMEKKVLVVDASLEQKIRYIVPAINPTKSYIVDLEKIDFAVGFYNLSEVKKYLGLKEETLSLLQKENQIGIKTEALAHVQDDINDNLPYDYVLLNIDSEEGIKNFKIENNLKNYFVTTFDMFSLRKGIEILSNIQGTIQLTKVLYNYDITTTENEEYLNFLSMDSKIIWNDTAVYLPILDEDSKVLEENQRVFKIRIKKLSSEYQEGIMYITKDILEEKNMGKIKKSIKE